MSEQMPKMHQAPCDPPIGEIRFGDTQDPEVATRLAAMFAEDQGVRAGGSIDWEAEHARGKARMAEVLGYLAEGRIVAGEALYHAAMIFQHGNCPEHFQITSQLAERAMQQGYPPAAWLYAASIDRYLMNTGKPQKFGTQYFAKGDEDFYLWPVDPATTDEERRRYNVPALAEAQQRAVQMNKQRTGVYRLLNMLLRYKVVRELAKRLRLLK
jgi:hypothetical protein